ncbi:MAG: arginase family protein [bacterium]|nr:arginase family protein [bacterium]MDZ4286026.1 arginase family protein [Candidatus Sungbacteria bacterium]
MIVFKIRYDKGGGDKSLGARCGPKAIERAFQQVSWRGAEDGTPHPELQWIRAATSPSCYRKRAESVFADTLMPFIALSGDNSCSFETVRIVAPYVRHVALVVFDAHPDTCDSRHDPHAHWVRRLWDEGIVMPEKTIFFGIRDAEEVEMRYIKERQATLITPDEIYGFHSRRVSPLEYISLWQPISVHGLVVVVDIDVLDPAYAPGTGVLRAGGLHVRHIMRIIRELCTLPFAIKAAEICEVIPKKGNALRPRFDKRPDPCNLTVLAAEAIFRQMIRSISA